MKSKQTAILLKFFLFFLFLIIQTQSFTQNTYDRQLKYWYLRDRLRYFIARNDDPLTEHGSNLVITARNRNDDHWTFSDIADYGQESSMFGKYIGVLATEYSLLNGYGYQQEAVNTDQELTEALQAQLRRDFGEHYWSCPDVFDGFFVRHDVPADNATGNLFINSHTELNTYKGLLLPTDKLLDLTQNLPAIVNVNRIGNYSWNYGEPMSNDEVIFTLEGLALAYHFGSSAAQTLAQTYALAMINKCFDGGLWQFFEPDCSIPPNPPVEPVGGDCTWLSTGFSKVEDYFNGIPYEPFSYSPAWWAESAFNGWLDPTTSHKVAGLAAIGKGWGSRTQEGIFNNTDGSNNWKEYYLWLYDALWDYHHDYINTSEVESLLDCAPCEGPWRINQAICAPNGWASSDRWYHTVGEQSGSSGFTGIFSGLDYMILLNLYYICNVENCTSCGVDYENRVDAIVNGTWPQGANGSFSQPRVINTFRTITSTENVLSGVSSGSGDVEYHAGDEIYLKPGFYSEQGTRFIAYPQNLVYCPNGPSCQADSPNKPDSIMNLSYSTKISDKNYPDYTNKEKIIIYKNNSVNSLSSIIIYPNPTDGIVKIHNTNNEPVRMVIKTIEGITIIENSVSSKGDDLIDLRSFPNGLYFVHFISDNNVYIAKIIKE